MHRSQGIQIHAAGSLVEGATPREARVTLGRRCCNAGLQDRPLELRTLVGCYSVWEDEADDEANIGWLRKAMEALEPLAFSPYVAETDLLADPPARLGRSPQTRGSA